MSRFEDHLVLLICIPRLALSSSWENLHMFSTLYMDIEHIIDWVFCYVPTYYTLEDA